MAKIIPETIQTCFLIASVVLIGLLPSNLPAAEQTCPNTNQPGDEAIWNSSAYLMTQQWYRDDFVDHYNLKKGNWDEGWGWAKYNDPNPAFEFPKMMSVGRLLWSGIDFSPPGEALESQGAWATFKRRIGTGTEAEPYPIMRAVSRTADEVDLLFADASGRLIHILYFGGPWFPGSIQTYPARLDVSNLVTPSVPFPKNTYRISTTPEVVATSADNLEVIARQQNTLLHFRWSRSAGWSVLEPTILTRRTSPVNGSDRYFVHSTPVVLRRSSTSAAFDVFALDNFRHLIHYSWDGGAWYAEDVTDQLQDGLRLAGDPVVSNRSDGTIDIVGRCTHGRLLYYRRDPGTGSWSSERVDAATDGLPVNLLVEGQPAAVSPGGASSPFIYYRVGYKLYFLTKMPWAWIRFPVAQDYAVVSDPVVVKRGLNQVHAFVRSAGGVLIHTWFAPPDGIGDERVTAVNPLGVPIFPPVDDSPTVIVTDEKRLDVFFRTTAGHLIHNYWTEQVGWKFENIHLTPGVSPTFDKLGPRYVALLRGDSSLEVFAEFYSRSDYTIHLSSSFGPAVSAWHSNDEYSNWASGKLHGFKYVPGVWNGDCSPIANALRGLFVKDRIQVFCPAFSRSPARRAGTMLHEATHMIFWRWNHQSNLPGSDCLNCNGNIAPCSDNWFAHGALAPSGLLTGVRNHSMNQIQIEYLTDISEFPRYWVTTSMTASALADARNRMNNRILNPPGWVPGTPRPLQ